MHHELLAAGVVCSVFMDFAKTTASLHLILRKMYIYDDSPAEYHGFPSQRCVDRFMDVCSDEYCNYCDTHTV